MTEGSKWTARGVVDRVSHKDVQSESRTRRRQRSDAKVEIVTGTHITMVGGVVFYRKLGEIRAIVYNV
jgi:hypothetical protein